VMLAIREAGCVELFKADEHLIAALEQRMAAAVKMLQRRTAAKTAKPQRRG